MVAHTVLEVCHYGFILISHAGGFRKVSYKDYPAANKVVDNPASPASIDLQRYEPGCSLRTFVQRSYLSR